MSKVISVFGLGGLVVLSLMIFTSRDNGDVEEANAQDTADLGGGTSLELADSSVSTPENGPETTVRRTALTPDAVAAEKEPETPKRSQNAELLARARWNFGLKARKTEQVMGSDFFNPTGKRLKGEELQGLHDLLGEINVEMKLVDEKYAHTQSDVFTKFLLAGRGTVLATGSSVQGRPPTQDPEQEISVSYHRGRLLELRVSFGDDIEYDRYRKSVAEQKGEAIERIREYIRNAN